MEGVSFKLTVMPKECKVEGCCNPVFTHGYCYNHRYLYYNTRKKGKTSGRIKPISDKRAEVLKEYREVRDDYMHKHEICEVKGCSKLANDLHHKMGREHNFFADDWARDNDVPLLIDVRFFMAVCRKHHEEFDLRPEWAKEKGYVIPKR